MGAIAIDYKAERRAKWARWITATVTYLVKTAQYVPVYLKYRTRTMIGPRVYLENLALIAVALKNGDLKDGAFVECGTWRGGMAAGMFEVGGRNRRYYFFDSFAGLPPAKDIDGDTARQWQADPKAPHHHNNCTASLEEFNRTLKMAGLPPDIVEVRKGFFEDTLPSFRPPPIAVLRLDGDWYESTMICLETFWDSVMPGGLILIDDYYAWEGCTKAVHEFLAKRQRPEPIYQGPFGRVAFILKKDRKPANV